MKDIRSLFEDIFNESAADEPTRLAMVDMYCGFIDKLHKDYPMASSDLIDDGNISPANTGHQDE